MKSITLCIRGGGVKAPTIGVLQALEEVGVPISRVSGSSIGSIIATLVATRTESAEIERLFKQYVVQLSTTRNSQIVEDIVNEQCHNKTFGELRIPLYIVANKGGVWNPEPYLFSIETTPNITLGEACRASCRFPLLFRRYKKKIDGTTFCFCDGGMAMNPFLPEKDNSVMVLSTFLKAKENRKSRYASAWLVPEEKADFVVKPYLGNMGTRGDERDIELSRMVGYYEMWRQMRNLLKLL